MKPFYTFILLILMGSTGIAQDQDSLDIINLYDSFESTVVLKDVENHLSLFSNDDAPVYNVIKYPNGPIFFNFSNLQFWTSFFEQEFPYELQITDVELYINNAFAISDAHYDEYVNDEFTASGRDLFGYIKTDNGWKLHYLHNTIVLAEDTNQYLIPFTLPNTINSVIDDFVEYHNDLDGESLSGLFADSHNQIISFNGSLSSSYNVEDAWVDNFAQVLSNTVTDRFLALSNLEIHIVDDYLASVFCDYTLTLENDFIESGQTWFNLIGSVEEGWVLSSVALNNTAVLTSISDVEEEDKLLVYPNPASGLLRINSSSAIESFRIIDGLGRVNRSEKVNAEYNLIIDISDMKPGVYFVSTLLENGNERISKLMIE